MDNISALVGRIETLPASPALLPRLARTLDNINTTDINEIVDIVMFDSALTAKLLQIANSAYFGSSAAISNVGEAISQLGYDAVFLLAAAISGEKSLRVAPGTGLDAVFLWNHSILAAFGAQHVAQASGLDANLGFTTGLLHDLGKIIFAETYGRHYTVMFDPARRQNLPLIAWETEQYGCNHAEVGAALLENWKLPRSLIMGVKFHHQPSSAGDFAPLAACASLGNVLSRSLGKPAFAADPDCPETGPALEIVKLKRDDLEAQWSRIQKKWAFVQALCDLRK